MSISTSFIALGVCCAAAFAQQTAASRFAGTWEAQHEGVAYFTATIEVSGDKISGKVVTIFVHADAEGNIVEIRAEPREEGPIQNAAIKGDRLTFDVKESDGGVETYSITPTGGDTADLRVSDAPPTFRFKLRRTRKP